MVVLRARHARPYGILFDKTRHLVYSQYVVFSGRASAHYKFWGCEVPNPASPMKSSIFLQKTGGDFMTVRILTDSTCDIERTWLDTNGVKTLPLKVLFGTEEYQDGVTLSKAQFFEKLRAAKTPPTTSQITPGEFSDAFRSVLDQGDEVVLITLSSSLSGTYQSAVFAANALGSEHVFLVDSQAATCSHALLVRIALDLAQQGLPGAEIFERLQTIKNKVRLLICLDTLHYLKMGGRLPASSAFIGELLNIKPLITLEDGKVSIVEKKRSFPKGLEWIVDKLAAGGIDPAYPVCTGHSDAPHHLENFQNLLRKKGVTLKDEMVVEIGAVIATHAGPGAVGIGFVEL
jgi:DegV family protein with EDD domain